MPSRILIDPPQRHRFIGERAQFAQQIGRPFRAARLAVGRQALQLAAHLLHHGRIQQFAQIDLAKQIPQQAAVQ
ncbi:hypothetical protein D3C71_1325300 [compost metagenome]